MIGTRGCGGNCEAGPARPLVFFPWQHHQSVANGLAGARVPAELPPERVEIGACGSPDDRSGHRRGREVRELESRNVLPFGGECDPLDVTAKQLRPQVWRAKSKAARELAPQLAIEEGIPALEDHRAGVVTIPQLQRKPFQHHLEAVVVGVDDGLCDGSMSLLVDDGADDRHLGSGDELDQAGIEARAAVRVGQLPKIASGATDAGRMEDHAGIAEMRDLERTQVRFEPRVPRLIEDTRRKRKDRVLRVDRRHAVIAGFIDIHDQRHRRLLVTRQSSSRIAINSPRRRFRPGRPTVRGCLPATVSR